MDRAGKLGFHFTNKPFHENLSVLKMNRRLEIILSQADGEVRACGVTPQGVYFLWGLLKRVKARYVWLISSQSASVWKVEFALCYAPITMAYRLSWRRYGRSGLNHGKSNPSENE